MTTFLATTHFILSVWTLAAMPRQGEAFVRPDGFLHHINHEIVVSDEVGNAPRPLHTAFRTTTTTTGSPPPLGSPPNYRRHRRRLYGTSSSPEQEDPEMETTRSSGINVGLIGQNIANQALIGATIWTGGAGYRILMDHTDWSVVGIAGGVVGVLPLLALSRYLESSESYLVSGLNLSTNLAVLRLFGPRPKPILALFISMFLAGITGIVEEVTFRGQLIPFFAERFGDGDWLVGATLATLLFAGLHTNPVGFFKGGDALLDNAVLLALQLVNGTIFALLYLGTGNLAVPIVAHALYDLYTFYKTHLVDVAGQMQYALERKDMPDIANKALERRWIAERGEDFVKSVAQTFYLMDTNRDGVLSRKELRIALFSYGINLSEQQSAKVARSADLDESGAIDLDEFLEFVGPTGSTGKAVRNTLFGPL